MYNFWWWRNDNEAFRTFQNYYRYYFAQFKINAHLHNGINFNTVKSFISLSGFVKVFITKNTHNIIVSNEAKIRSESQFWSRKLNLIVLSWKSFSYYSSYTWIPSPSSFFWAFVLRYSCVSLLNQTFYERRKSSYHSIFLAVLLVIFLCWVYCPLGFWRFCFPPFLLCGCSIVPSCTSHVLSFHHTLTHLLFHHFYPSVGIL